MSYLDGKCLLTGVAGPRPIGSNLVPPGAILRPSHARDCILNRLSPLGLLVLHAWEPMCRVLRVDCLVLLFPDLWDYYSQP